jgi:predicted metal-dependent hydrolase
MQLPLLSFWAPVEPASAASPALPTLKLIRNPRARRYVLRVNDKAEAVVTVPRWGSLRAARAFAEQHSEWIANERLRRMSEGAERVWRDGTAIWLRGERVTIAVAGDVARAGEFDATLAEGIDVKTALQAAVRAAARRELPPRLRALADRAGLRVARVSVRNQRSRWGSCSSRGSIALNWRLLLMPPAVCDYVLWHELMHLRRGDHSPAFWKLVEQVCPDYKAARAWLRKHGRELA